MEKLYSRELYLKKIRPFYYENEIIKVLTGVRRCGKSSIMKLIILELKKSGVDDSKIFYFNLDKRPYRNIKTADQLDELIANNIDKVSGDKYLFIDEIQNVTAFEEVINSFREDDNCSIFITGSNSYLLSGELATKLTGRYLEFNISTLSFYEYIEMKKFFKKQIDSDLEKEFNNYILEGGFPLAVKYDSIVEKRTYVKGIIKEIYEKDIKKNNKIRNKHLFEQVQTYIINNFGATTSVNSLCDYFEKVNGIRPTNHTIYNYLEILEKVKILSKCKRFDLKSKKSINGEEKYYLTDLSFYFSQQTDNRINYGPVLENIIYNYSLLSGYSASIGRIGNLEIDFILRNELTNDYSYVQVARTIDNGIYDEKGIPITEEREYAPLEKIKDGYPKYLLTMDKLFQRRSGVKHINIIDFIIKNMEF
ncbi:MAG: ATP-binding protein [bacterium]|nr:ATP-binding protein [bacterium]